MGKRLVALVLGVSVLSLAGTASAEMGQGIKAGQFTIMPGLEVKGIYNSNVQLFPDNEDSDVSAVLTPGVAVKQQSNMVKTDGALWGRFERFADLTEEDHDDFGENLSVSLWDRRSVLLKLSESFQSIQDLDYNVGTIQKRDLLDLGISAGRDLTDKLLLDGGVGYNSTAYENDALYDWDQTMVKVEAAHAMTPKSFGTLGIKAGSQSSDALTDDPTFATVLLGAKTRLTEKVVGNVGIGWYGYDSDVADVSMVGFDAAVAWQATEKLVIQGTANNRVEPAIQDLNNIKTVTFVSAAGVWKAMPTLSVTLSSFYMQNDYEQQVVDTANNGILADKTDDTVNVTLRATYLPPAKFFTVFGEVKQESKNSTLDAEDYDQTMVCVGGTVVY